MAWDEIYGEFLEQFVGLTDGLWYFAAKKKKVAFVHHQKKKEMQVHGDISVRELDQAEGITQTEVFESTVVTLVGCNLARYEIYRGDTKLPEVSFLRS